MPSTTAPVYLIRPVDHNSAEDQAAILDVYRHCEDFLSLGPVATASMEMVLADLAHSRADGGLFCGIYNPTSGKMMGIVDYVAAGFEGQPHLAFLSLLMIAAPYRSHGLGEAVVQEVFTAARCAGARTMRSGVQVNNPRAIRFWQRMGFSIISGPELMEDQTVVYGLERGLGN